MKRRTFLRNSGLATGGLVLPAWEQELQAATSKTAAAPGYQLKVLATNWGFDGTMDAFCAKAKKEGYDGIEVWWPGTSEAQQQLFDALKVYSLEVGFLCGGSQSNVEEHLKTFTAAVTAAAKNTRQKPLYINLHSGRDYFSEAENQRFINFATSMSQETGIKIMHETHRGRMMYSAPVCRNFLEKNPSLKLTLDISHWCNVHESLLADQPDTIRTALERVEHIHARIGHAEGPQVNDPRAPEWEAAVKAHFAWWDKVVERKKARGEVMTFLTEFGPADYMWTLPYTRQPLADQWDINVYMMKLLRKRYA